MIKIQVFWNKRFRMKICSYFLTGSLVACHEVLGNEPYQDSAGIHHHRLVLIPEFGLGNPGQ
jgi:hypothetical protein